MNQPPTKAPVTNRHHAPAKVVICGIHEDVITEDGTGVQRFATLQAAHLLFPELDIQQAAAQFTAAMPSRYDDEIRFETHQAAKLYSSKLPGRTSYAKRSSSLF